MRLLTVLVITVVVCAVSVTARKCLCRTCGSRPTTPKPAPKTTEKPVVVTTVPEEITTMIPTLAPCTYPVTISNVALNKPASQSSLKKKTDHTADLAVDGDTTSYLSDGSCSETHREEDPWWKVDLGQSKDIYEIVIYNEQDKAFRLKTSIVRVGDNPDHSLNPQCGAQVLGRMTNENPVIVRCGCQSPMRGRYVSIQLKDKERPLSLCEVQVMAG
ncbi:fucolectin-1-like isoform X2 [Glandiceps talaboti]